MNLEGKLILDACCGSKMMWFEKNDPRVLYCDIRQEEHTLCDGRHLEVKPDLVCDFRNLPLPSDHFIHVAMDPPHMNKLGKDSYMALKYGVLLPTWKDDLRQGVDECFRVLKPGGTFILKWNEYQISVRDLINAIGKQPLYGHPTRHAKTHWLAFIK